jgi:uncharacterized membrane protein
MTRESKVLDRHFRHWRETGLLSEDLEARLRAASHDLSHAAAASTMRKALAGLGAGLLLAGLVLIVAENWEVLHRGVKLAGWALIQVGLLWGADRLGRSSAPRYVLAEALAFVSAGWVLAGIALVSQIYHLDARPPNGIWLWLVLLLPAAWLQARAASSFAVFAALVVGLVMEAFEEDSLVHVTNAAGLWLWLAVPLLGGTLASWLPRPVPFQRTLVGAWTFLAANFFLLVFGAAQELTSSTLGKGWILVALGLAAGLLFPKRCLPPSWGASARVLLVLALLPWILNGSKHDPGYIPDLLAVGLAWVVQLGLAVLLIRSGARSGSESWVNIGYLALLAGIVTRYFDFFGDYLEGGLALVVTGAGLLLLLFLVERSRRRTMAAEVQS